MEDLLWNLVPWGYQALLNLEGMRSGFLNVVFSIITDLGSNIGYVVILSLIYWCIDKRMGQGLAYVSLFSATLNIWLKYIWPIPRPGDAALDGVLRRAGIARRVAPLREATLPSFPSGHAQGAAVAWGYIARRGFLSDADSGPTGVDAKPAHAEPGWRWSLPRRRFWYVAAALIALIAFSRVYLGVHFPQDVVAGVVIGAAYLLVWLWAEPRVRSWLAAIGAGWRYALAVLVPLAALAVRPGADANRVGLGRRDTAAAMGTAVGVGVGYLFEAQTVRFSVAGQWKQRAARGVLGLVLTLAAYFGLRALFGLVHLEGGLAYGWRTLRYALLGLVAGCGAPWVFVWTGLARRLRT